MVGFLRNCYLKTRTAANRREHYESIICQHSTRVPIFCLSKWANQHSPFGKLYEIIHSLNKSFTIIDEHGNIVKGGLWTCVIMIFDIPGYSKFSVKFEILPHEYISADFLAKIYVLPNMYELPSPHHVHMRILV